MLSGGGATLVLGSPHSLIFSRMWFSGKYSINATEEDGHFTFRWQIAKGDPVMCCFIVRYRMEVHYYIYVNIYIWRRAANGCGSTIA